MEMIDLGKGVRVCATDRSYFKCLVEGKKDRLGNPVYVTLRVTVYRDWETFYQIGRAHV